MKEGGNYATEIGRELALTWQDVWLGVISGVGIYIDNDPILIIVDGEILWDNVRRTHMDDSDVYEKLRLSGVKHLSQVKAAVLERSGAVSVIQGGPPDPDILRHVRGQPG